MVLLHCMHQRGESMKKSEFKRKLKNEEIFYNIVSKTLRPFLELRYDMTTHNEGILKSKEPYLIIGNHVMADDPIIVNFHSYKLIRYIASDTNYDTMWKRILLSLGGAIPFSKGNSDFKAVKHLLRLVKNSKPVGLYPEGGRSWSGETEEIIFSTAKLIKVLNTTVYRVMTKGGYLKKPRWADNYRKGKIHFYYDILFDKEEIKKLTAEEIYEKMKTSIYHNDYKWQKKNKQLYRGKNKAEHIERLLYICPNCKGIDTISSKENRFKCTKCGTAWKINDYGFIEGDHFDNTVDWNHWQKNILVEKLENNEITIETQNMNFEKFDKDGKKLYKEKIAVKLDSSFLNIKGESISESIEVENIKAISITLLDIFEFYNKDGEKYRFIFDPEINPSIILFLETLKFYTRR